MLGRRGLRLTQLEMVCIEDLVPSQHMVRRIDAVLDLGFLRRELAPLYADEGRPSEDPELILRMLLLGYLYDLSANRLMQELQSNAAFRWFCSLSFGDALPHRTTLIRTRHRWGTATFQKIFDRVVDGCIAAGLVKGARLALDGTQIRAHAAVNSLEALEPTGSTVVYLNRLEQELTGSDSEPSPEAEEPPSGTGSEVTTPEPLADPPAAPPSEKRRAGDPDFHGERFSNATHRSKTDPDARLYRKSPGQEAHLCYLGHYLIDRSSRVIVDATATLATGTAERDAGRYMIDRILLRLPAVDRRDLAADAGYAAGDFLAALLKRGIDLLIPMQRPEPEPVPTWKRRTFNLAHLRKRRQKVKVAKARNRARRLSTTRRYQQAHAERSRSEHLFAEAKQWHGLDRARGWGLTTVHEQTLLTGTVQNLKRLASCIHRRRPAAPAANGQSSTAPTTLTMAYQVVKMLLQPLHPGLAAESFSQRF